MWPYCILQRDMYFCVFYVAKSNVALWPVILVRVLLDRDSSFPWASGRVKVDICGRPERITAELVPVIGASSPYPESCWHIWHPISIWPDLLVWWWPEPSVCSRNPGYISACVPGNCCVCCIISSPHIFYGSSSGIMTNTHNTLPTPTPYDQHSQHTRKSNLPHLGQKL